MSVLEYWKQSSVYKNYFCEQKKFAKLNLPALSRPTLDSEEMDAFGVAFVYVCSEVSACSPLKEALLQYECSLSITTTTGRLFKEHLLKGSDLLYLLPSFRHIDK